MSAEENAPATLPVRGDPFVILIKRPRTNLFARNERTMNPRTKSLHQRRPLFFGKISRAKIARAHAVARWQFGAGSDNAATINLGLSSRPALDDDAGKFPRDKRVARIERAGSCEEERYTTPARSTYDDTIAERGSLGARHNVLTDQVETAAGRMTACMTTLSPSLVFRLSHLHPSVSELICTWRDATKLFAPELDSGRRDESNLPRTSALDPEGSAATLRVPIEIIPFARYRRIIRRLSREVGARIAWHPARDVIPSQSSLKFSSYRTVTNRGIRPLSPSLSLSLFPSLFLFLYPVCRHNSNNRSIT